MKDILFKTDDFAFSYRVAGICVQNGKVLLQKVAGAPAHTFPGGHMAFGETQAQALAREFKEELGVDISVGELQWVGELFFPWDGRCWQQICLYYAVEITTPGFPREGMVEVLDQLEERTYELEFHWVPLKEAAKLEMYPETAPELLEKLGEGVQHFIYEEQ